MRPASIDRNTICSPNRERGTTAVEVAILAPILVLIFLAIVDVGMLIWEHQVIQNAAREGARFSAQPFNSMAAADPSGKVGPTPAQLQQGIQQFVVNCAARQNVTISASSVTVNQQYPIVVNGLTLYGSQITVSYSRSVLMPGGSMLGFTSLNLGATSIFRNLYW